MRIRRSFGGGLGMNRRVLFLRAECISDGSMFYPEQKLNVMDNKKAYSVKIDDFLIAYGDYKAEQTDERRKKLLALANECSLMYERFKFEEV